ITLPFLSYGGSSMLASFIYIGVIQSISTHNQKYYFERETA
ncbi:MAG: FtsW/RodA/SpoVE family cell cycle protein, partial [Clostridia bacterium]|nr:FtsW/RodA/SpoVE family cell cycle protein [Clostridia bacterium]